MSYNFINCHKHSVIDLFAGPGGLGEGFSAYHSEEGWHPFQIRLSIEKDATAHRTLTLRAFYRSFICDGRRAPDDYYRYLAGKISLDELSSAWHHEWENAKLEAWHCELGGDTFSHEAIDERIRSALNTDNKWLLIGGPPCQAYSLVGRARMRYAKDYQQKHGHDFQKDHRHKLYREYLRIIAKFSPAVFVMENVKGILSSKLDGERIFPKILEDLSDPASAATQYGWNNVGKAKYRVVSFVTGKKPESGKESDYLIRAEDYGIPQARHRVILLGIREDIFVCIDGQTPYLEKLPSTDLQKVIGELPPLRSGFSKGQDSIERWKKYFVELKHERWLESMCDLQRDAIEKALKMLSSRTLDRAYMDLNTSAPSLFNHWFEDRNMQGLTHHSTRSHMDSDLARYFFVATYGAVMGRSPHLVDFPIDLLPDHKNVDIDRPTQKFADRFKVQLWNRPSSTITSHISKDGHYFIHPDPTQCRSLTVREAARIQTFPDNYYFEGGRTAQYHQVGNAVPPVLARQLAKVVHKIMAG